MVSPAKRCTSRSAWPHPVKNNAPKNKNEVSNADLVSEFGKKKLYKLILTTKVIQHNIFVFYTQALEELDYRGVHHWWAAHVEFAVFWCRMIFQVVFIQHVVDEACETIPVVFRLRIRQSSKPFEVFVVFLQLVVFFFIGQLTQGTRTVPEGHLTLGLDTPQLIEDVGTHRSHTGTTAD